MMGQAMRLREELATIGNDIEALDRTLVALGYDGDIKGLSPRSNRVVFFHRNELRRFCIDELCKATAPITSRELVEKIAKLEGKDTRDRRLMTDMVKRVGKSLKLLRQQGFAKSDKNRIGGIVWRGTLSTNCV